LPGKRLVRLLAYMMPDTRGYSFDRASVTI
jgi:hypothetical protein